MEETKKSEEDVTAPVQIVTAHKQIWWRQVQGVHKDLNAEFKLLRLWRWSGEVEGGNAVNALVDQALRRTS